MLIYTKGRTSMEASSSVHHSLTQLTLASRLNKQLPSSSVNNTYSTTLTSTTITTSTTMAPIQTQTRESRLTSLKTACSSGDADKVRSTLRSWNANIHEPRLNDQELSQLSQAAILAGNFQVLELLLEMGWKTNARRATSRPYYKISKAPRLMTPGSKALNIAGLSCALRASRRGFLNVPKTNQLAAIKEVS